MNKFVSTLVNYISQTTHILVKNIHHSVLIRFAADMSPEPPVEETGMTKIVCVLLALGLAVVAVRTASVVGKPP